MSKQKSKPALTVLQNPDDPIAKEVLAQSIERIADGFTKMQAGGLNRKAIIALLHDHTKLPKTVIAVVIDGIGSLRTNYCR